MRAFTIQVAAALQAVVVALWLGGVVWLMAGVQTLFAVRREVAVEAAPILFGAFERYHLALGVIALALALFVWRCAPGRRTLIMLVLILIASVAAFISGLVITPKVEALRLAGEGGSAQFKSLHGMSMLLYVCEALLVLVCVLLGAWRVEGRAHQA